MRRGGGLGVVLLAVLAAPAWGQVTIAWTFKEGDKLYLQNVTSTKQTVEVLGQSTPLSLTNTTVSSFTVMKKTADGVVLRQVIDYQTIKAEGQLAAQQERMALLMKGATFTFTLDNKGRITKVEGYDDLIKRLSEGNDEVAKVLRVMLSEDTLRQGVQEAFAFPPGKPVTKGDHWQSKMAISMGPLGQFAADQHYTYEGQIKDAASISTKGDFRFLPGKEDANATLPFRVTKADIVTKRAKGAILFDTNAGRMVSQEMDMHLAGPMTIAVKGQEAEMTMNMEMTVKLTWSDKKP